MADRSVTAAVELALAQPNIPLLLFVELDFASGFLRLTNAPYNFDWNGFTWLGAGNLGSVAPIEETTSREAKGASFRISGIDPLNISRALGEHYQGRPAKMWIALLSETYSVILNPVLIFTGSMDTMNIELGESASITVTAESKWVSWESPKIRRINHVDQSARYPGDKGCEFVEQMVSKELIWGRV